MGSRVRLVDLKGMDPEALDQALADLTDDEAEALLYEWREWARPDQIAPLGTWWSVWLLLGGRGAGKTRAGAEWIREQVKAGAKRIALVAPTAADARDTIVEGESGILAIHPESERPEYEPSKRRLTWSNGAVATLFSADEPDRLRGPQHEVAWCDELAAWRYLEESWSNLMMGLRLGESKCLASTTPRPLALIRDLVSRNGKDVAVVRASTRENLDNLSKAFRSQIIAQYEGTRLGRQELEAEILDDVPGALWTRDVIEETRVNADQIPELVRIVVAVDPAISSNDTSDYTGIVVVGKGADDHYYVLADATMKGTPNQWATKVATVFEAYDADKIVAERNQGGEMVETTIQAVDDTLPVKLVNASRGKTTRAEPVAALYERGFVHHTKPMPELEDQMCNYDGSSSGDSPDRMDALVWGCTELKDKAVEQPAVAAPITVK